LLIETTMSSSLFSKLSDTCERSIPPGLINGEELSPSLIIPAAPPGVVNV
jgi:hypothetical protein